MQYFTGLPVVLVRLHLVGAVLVTAFTARLVWSVRGPASELPGHVPGPATAAQLTRVVPDDHQRDRAVGGHPAPRHDPSSGGG